MTTQAQPAATAPTAALWRVSTHGPEATRALSACLGRVAVAGTVVLLSGELGSGKTVVAQGVGRGLQVPGVVNSPTFVLVSEHLGGRLPLFHADLYRLAAAGEIAELDLHDVARDGVLLVEWPQRAGDDLPADRITVSLTGGSGENDRNLDWRAVGPIAQSVLQALRDLIQREGLPTP